MRKLDHRDKNEPGIIAALERRGFLVQKLSDGDGVPDLLVGTPLCDGRRTLLLLEVKDGELVESRQRLRESQAKFAARWTGAPIHRVTTVREALSVCRQAVRSRGPVD